jgi:hypothetical protein
MQTGHFSERYKLSGKRAEKEGERIGPKNTS